MNAYLDHFGILAVGKSPFYQSLPAPGFEPGTIGFKVRCSNQAKVALKVSQPTFVRV